MYPLGKDFNGMNYETREGIFDENIILRTNYSFVVKKQTELFNTKNDNNINVIFSDPVTIFRDIEYNPINLNNVGSVAVISLLYKIMKKEGIELKDLEHIKGSGKNNRINKDDILKFLEFDLIYAMDTSNLKDILQLAPNENAKRKVHLILNEIYPNENKDVPDPYYGTMDDFMHVFTLLDKATDRIMQKIGTGEKW